MTATLIAKDKGSTIPYTGSPQVMAKWAIVESSNQAWLPCTVGARFNVRPLEAASAAPPIASPKPNMFWPTVIDGLASISLGPLSFNKGDLRKEG